MKKNLFLILFTSSLITTLSVNASIGTRSVALPEPRTIYSDVEDARVDGVTAGTHILEGTYYVIPDVGVETTGKLNDILSVKSWINNPTFIQGGWIKFENTKIAAYSRYKWTNQNTGHYFITEAMFSDVPSY